MWASDQGRLLGGGVTGRGVEFGCGEYGWGRDRCAEVWRLRTVACAGDPTETNLGALGWAARGGRDLEGQAGGWAFTIGHY